jgi:hypothetical protein
MALALRAEMRDDDKPKPRIARNALEERLQRFDAAGGGADADYGRLLASGFCDFPLLSRKLGL